MFFSSHSYFTNVILENSFNNLETWLLNYNYIIDSEKAIIQFLILHFVKQTLNQRMSEGRARMTSVSSGKPGL